MHGADQSNSVRPEDMPAEDVYVVERPEQIAALRSQVRQEVIEIICRYGPISVPEMAAKLARSDKSLYHHVKILVECDLVIEDIVSIAGRQVRQYRAVSDQFVFPTNPTDTETIELVADVVSSGFRGAARAIENELLSGTATRRGGGRNLVAGRFQGWVNKRELAKINRCINEVISMLSTDKEPSKNAQHITVNFGLYRTPGVSGRPGGTPSGTQRADGHPGGRDASEGGRGTGAG